MSWVALGLTVLAMSMIAADNRRGWWVQVAASMAWIMAYVDDPALVFMNFIILAIAGRKSICD